MRDSSHVGAADEDSIGPRSSAESQVRNSEGLMKLFSSPSSRMRISAPFATLLMLAGVVPLATATQAMTAPAAAAFSAPSVVKDISGNSVTSGTLFGGRPEAFAVNPVNRQIVLSAEEVGGLWRSNNAGDSWAHVDASVRRRTPAHWARRHRACPSRRRRIRQRADTACAPRGLR